MKTFNDRDQNMMMPSPEQLIGEVTKGNEAMSNFVAICRCLLASGSLDSNQKSYVKDFLDEHI